MPLSTTIIRAIGAPLGFALVAVPGAILVDDFGTAGIVGPDAQPPAASVSYPDRLVQKYGCWTGEAPADMQGEFPGHVILREEGGDWHYSVRVGDALDQAFGEADHGLTIYAFCR